MNLQRETSRVTSKHSPLPYLFINLIIDLFLQEFSQFIPHHIIENKSETNLIADVPSYGKTKLLEQIF